MNQKPYNKCLINLVCSVCTGKYLPSVFFAQTSQLGTKTSGKLSVWNEIQMKIRIAIYKFWFIPTIEKLYQSKQRKVITLLTVNATGSLVFLDLQDSFTPSCNVFNSCSLEDGCGAINAFICFQHLSAPIALIDSWRCNGQIGELEEFFPNGLHLAWIPLMKNNHCLTNDTTNVGEFQPTWMETH